MRKYSRKYKDFLIRKSKQGNSSKGHPKKRKIPIVPNRSVTPQRVKKRAQSVVQTGAISYKVTPVRLIAPDDLRLTYSECENVTGFIHRIKSASRSSRNIIVDLENVSKICDGTISMLLSVIKEIGRDGVRVKGTYPKDIDARNFLEKSGFFGHIRGHVSPSNGETKNTIIRTGDSRTPPAEVSQEIYNSMETVWGTKGRNPLLRGGVFEMVRNSCDHAFSNSASVFWHFSLSHHEDEELVSYSFVDNGKGIIRTMSSKGIIDKIFDYFKSNSNILKAAFENGIESATGLPWRGKGLPTIYELYEDKVVTNLIVVSNNVFIDFDRNLRKEIKFPFSGTYYHWVINPSCKKYCFN
ncbi:hypothetical protein [Marinifilum flexuosum]|uniref:hypothetical protein n=1 Tax=Marinifilum flexuosum TaxID=1117708 RepID=UPI002494F00C|nr:hypothetical protein [Marinifilum flexuosum]